MDYLWPIFKFILEIIASSGIAIFIINKWVDFFYTKKAEKYKHLLNLITEDAKYDYQRRLFDFNLYVQQKHKIYSELFRLIMIADGGINGLRGLVSYPSFDGFSLNDIKDYLSKLNVPGGFFNDIVIIWDTNQDQATKKIYNQIKLRNYKEAQKTYDDARNYYWLSTIYLSEQVSNGCKMLINKMGKLLMNYEDGESVASSSSENKTLKKEIAELIINLIEIMKKELIVLETKKVSDSSE